jgi:hypothetical protein
VLEVQRHLGNNWVRTGEAHLLMPPARPFRFRWVSPHSDECSMS